MAKPKFFSLKPILQYGADYNVIIGERSNGKTYSTLDYSLEDYDLRKGKFIYLRRWSEDLKPKRLGTLFEPLYKNNLIKKYTKGEWDNISYYAGRFFFTKTVTDEKGRQEIIKDNNTCGYALALSAMEHDKSTSYPDVNTIIFDEFISRSAYLPDEFSLFTNVLSTIIRHRDDVKIFMLGNTVNKYCPYFNEMGLKHIKNMTQGKIDLYTYGDSPLKVAVEYCGSIASKPSEKYFAFDNPKLKMITEGAWEMAIYPRLPEKYKPSEVKFKFFIEFDEEKLQCNVIKTSNGPFIFVHRKTGEFKNPDKDLIYSTEYSNKKNRRMVLTKPTNEREKAIMSLIEDYRIFYQGNEVGEIFRNYLLWCRQFSVIAK